MRPAGMAFRVLPVSLLWGMLVASTVSGMLLGSVDFLSGLHRFWGADPDPGREFRSWAAAAGFFAAVACAVHFTALAILHARHRLEDGGVGIFSTGVALLAGYGVALAVPSDFSLTQSIVRGSMILLGIALPLTVILTLNLVHRGDRPSEMVSSLDRLWTSAAFGIGSFVAATALARASVPDGRFVQVRFIPLLVCLVVWLASLAILHSSKANLLRGVACATFLVLIARAAWLPALPRLLPEAKPPGVPEDLSGILLITVDTLRADALSCYGANGTSTPHIDSLARRGLRYENAIAPSSWTLPSIVSIMTGTSVAVHGTTSLTTPVPQALPTLPERLSEMGFVTGAIGRNSFLVGERGLNRGFQTYEMYPQVPKLDWPTVGFQLLNLLPSSRSELEIDTRSIADFSIQWLETHADEPFFLWCHFFDPHTPYEPPKEYLPPGPAPEGIGHELTETPAIRSGKWRLGETEEKWIRELYLAEVRYVDTEIGRILEAVEKSHGIDRTLIILTSDHGEEFWEHGGFEHGHSLYQEVIHVPLILAYPGRVRSGVVDRTIGTEAITPTILALINGPPAPDSTLAAPLPIPGVSEPAEAPVFSTGILYGPDQESVIDRSWKYVKVPSTGEQSLFDLDQDPSETRNLAGEVPSVAGEATALLEEWRGAAERERAKLEQEEQEAVDLSDDHLQDLKRLGYIN